MRHFSRRIAIVMMVFAAFGLSAVPRDGIDVRIQSSKLCCTATSM